MLEKHSLLQAITRRKSDNVPSENNKDSALKRCLELKDLTMIGIGSTLGAGVYILSGQVAAGKAGPAVTLCFGIAAIASILSGMCYAELGCRVPKAGSGYAYLYVCIGELAAFTIGWCLLLSYILGASSVASALSGYLDELSGGWVSTNLDQFPLGWPYCRDTINLSAIILICILGALMMTGIEEASKVTNVCTFINIATLAALIILSLFNIDFSNWTYPQDSTGSIEKSAIENFYQKYLIDTDGIKDNYDAASNSFINKYCVNNTYSTQWTEIETPANSSQLYQFSAYCQIQDRHVSPENREDAPVNETYSEPRITLPEGEYFSAKQLPFNETSNVAQIVNTKPGYGGYIPFNMNGVLQGATTCFYGFVGFDAIATTGEEAVNPQRDIPRAIVFSLMVICLVYLAISGLLTISFPYFALSASSPFPAAFYYNGMSWIVIFIKIGAICALTSSLIGAVIPMPRILWNMAQDGLVFNWCAKVSKKSKTPLNATIIATILAAFLAGIFRLDILVDVMSIGTLAAYALVALCVLILRYRPDDVDLVNKAGPNEKQGEQSTKLIYYISGWYLLAGIVMNKIELWIPDNLGLADNIFKVCAISMVVFSIYVIYVLNKIPQSTKDLAFKVPFLPYFPLLNLAINLYLMAALTLEVWIQLLVWLSLGFAIYFFYGVEHSIESPEQQRFLGSNSEDEGYRNKEKEANQQV